jgi:hypothetical protein
MKEHLVIGGLGYSASLSYKNNGKEVVDIDLLSFFDNNDFNYQIEKLIRENSNKNIHLGCVSLQPEFNKICSEYGLKTTNLIDIIKQNYIDNSIIICTKKSSLYFEGYNTFSSTILDSYIYNDICFGKPSINAFNHLNHICNTFKDKNIILGCTDFSIFKNDIKVPNIIDCVDLHVKSMA